MNLLFVCTANVCRSPVAERLAVAWAREQLGPELGGLSIGSAGVDAFPGQEMDPSSAAALTRLGGDPAGVRARALTAPMAEQADLVLTMTRRQRQTVLELAPRGLRRTFTLLEAVDLLEEIDLRPLDRLAPPDRFGELALQLNRARAHRPSTEADDIEDPIGRRPAVHRRVAQTIADAVWPLLVVIAGDAPAR